MKKPVVLFSSNCDDMGTKRTGKPKKDKKYIFSGNEPSLGRRMICMSESESK